MMSVTVFLMFFAALGAGTGTDGAGIGTVGNTKKISSPPHCTQVSKDTDYVSRFKMAYPVVYLIPGQHEAYQQLHCVNPPAVNKAVTTVCDWAAPPQVQFTLGDEYMHVVRQDPTGQFSGNAVITTYQLCSHSLPSFPMHFNETNLPAIIVTRV